MDIKAFLTKYWRKTLGFLLIIGGIFGLVLPFFQGIAMILAGLVLMGNKTAVQWLERLREKFKASRKNK